MEYRNFIGPSNRSQSPISDCERTVNFYLEQSDVPGAKSPMAMYPMPGLQAFLTVAQGPWRALAAQDGRAFGVAGFKFYELFSDGTYTDRGDVASNGNPATISFNGQGPRQVFITVGRSGYLFNLDTNVLSTVVANVDVGAFIDGYFVALDASLSILKRSNLEDGATWDAGNNVQRQTASDVWKGLAVKNREIWLIGSQSSDVYTGTGQANLPFAPIPQGLVQAGTPAAFSPAVLGDTGSMAWIGANDQGQGTIVATVGLETKRISTHALDLALQGYGDLSGAFCYNSQYQGHNFLLVNIPSVNASWVYDTSTNLWTERLFWDRTTAAWLAHRGACHCFAFGKHLVGDRLTGALYEETGTIAVDADGLGMRRLRIATHVANEGKNVIINRLRLDMQTGVGLSSGQGSDPMAMMQYSVDGGSTYSYERQASVGKIGKYGTLVEWRRMGAGRDWVFQVNFSDPVPWRVNQAWLDLGMGRN